MDSKAVFDLRKEAKNLIGVSKLTKLNQALNIAQGLFSTEPNDEWIQKALAYTLIDLSKHFILNKDIGQAGVYFSRLLSIDFQEVDDIIENQKNFLRPKIDVNYSEVQKAEELSKNGNHQDALSVFKKLISENCLTELHHEAYGWIIYRYIKDKESELNSIQVRKLLRDYMNLKNERPSMLHSMILNFALHYSKDHSDFNLYSFFKLWDPSNLRIEDKDRQHFNDKEIPSLVSRIIREFIDKDLSIDIEYLIDNINMKSWNSRLTSKHQILDFLREPSFWKLINAHKDSSRSELWNIFEKYNLTFSKYEGSKWHSEVLSLAERYMQEGDTWRFLDFFKMWNPKNFLDQDWDKVYKEDKVYNSLAVKCYIKAFHLNLNENRINEAIKVIDGIEVQSRKEEVIDLLRESFFWKLFNAQKENIRPELWNTFNKYNQIFSRYKKSKWHSEILNLAERFMQEVEEWRFLDFFKVWGPDNLCDEDWKEVKKEDKIYKPLAIKCIKKSFEIIKSKNSEFNENWLLAIYSKAVILYPEDEWLLRENALLLIKSNQLELSINIYKKLVLELGDKSYIWNEFSSCFENNADLRIGMLSKAIQLEKNEDFLGDIHLELAKTLLTSALIDNCIVELNLYKRHRELKGWRLSTSYLEISEKTANHNVILKDNKNLYNKYAPIAELFAYEDFEWTEVILVDKWKNNEGKERIAFTNGKTIDFSIGSRRFGLLKQASFGNIYKFKLYKQEIKREVEAQGFRMRKTIVTEYKYVPLLVEKSEKSDWTILDDIYAAVDYINIERGIIHAISSDNKEVFFPKENIQLQIGDFIKAKYFAKNVKGETRIELKDITKIDREIAVVHFPKIIAIIDGVNKEKNLFHYVGNKTIHGVIRFKETDINPAEGKFLEIRYTSKKHKSENRTIIKAIQIRETNETNPELIKSINGILELKYKRDGITLDHYDLDIEDMDRSPDFGFVGDFYVPKNVLSANKITYNCNITATAIFLGDKWKIIKLEKV